MKPRLSFHEVVEAIERLSIDEQETLSKVLCRRLAERRRLRLVAEVRQADEELKAGKCRPATVDEIMKALDVLEDLEDIRAYHEVKARNEEAIQFEQAVRELEEDE